MKKKMSILAALVLAVVVTTYSVSGTYAKYTSTFNGTTSTARVAQWAISVGDLDQSSEATETFTFDLFESVDDENVKKGADGENIIAPGTEGSFKIDLKNDSEVNAEYTVDYTVNNAGVPLEFSIDNGATWTTGLTDVATPVAINMNGAEDSITIQWRWAFTGDASENYKTGDDAQTDETDTTLGIAGSATPSVSAKIVVNQVD